MDYFEQNPVLLTEDSVLRDMAGGR